MAKTIVKQPFGNGLKQFGGRFILAATALPQKEWISPAKNWDRIGKTRHSQRSWHLDARWKPG